MPLIETKGAASAQGFGEFAKTGEAVYIESVFSTHLYTGNGSTQTITNGIDLAGKGGLVWMKGRNNAVDRSHNLVDTARGTNSSLFTNLTNAAATASDRITAFSSTGFSLGSSFVTNENTYNYVSWTFRKQPKFFDVVTYTGDGNANRTVSHNLGSVPGCIIVKTVSSANDWVVSHRSLVDQIGFLNQTWEFGASAHLKNSLWTSTTFTPGNAAATNQNGVTYVAYLFAHDAGGFGLTGTDNVISCGSFTVSGNAATVNLGYEPQWLLIKSAASVSAWDLFDSMRGLQVSGNQPVLNAQSSGAEFGTGSGVGVNVTSTGFATNGYLGNGNHIYIAIRRGPMKTPTTGTSVFEPVLLVDGVTNKPPVNASFSAPDSAWSYARNAIYGFAALPRDRLVSNGISYLATNLTDAEASYSGNTDGFSYLQKGIDGANAGSTFNQASPGTIYWMFKRAPGFFDVVCYTGTGANRTVSHNLGVVPELMIVKRRNAGSEFDWWPVYSKAPFNDPVVYQLNTTSGAFNLPSVWNFTNPTASVFSVGTSQTTNASGGTYVAYLFASCPGVSKCGSYTGTGALQTIDCGFTGGARFVLIKRYDNTGDWWVYDSARGISSGNDPYLFLNSTAAEVTGTNYVDTTSVGFQVTAAAPAGLNANGGTYIFLAIA